MSDKLKVSRTVEHAIGVRGAEVAEALESVLFPKGAPKTLTTAEFVNALGDTLARVGAELKAADLAHAAELADDDGYRQKREEAHAELVELLQRTRGILASSYGSSGVARAGLATPSPRGNQQLVSYAQHVANQLTDDILGEPLDELVPIKLDALRKRVKAAAETLEGSLSDIERERREAQQTHERRTDATEAWSKTYVGVANGFVALAALAGFDEIAERVKPTARRRAGRPEAIDEEMAEEMAGEDAKPGEEAGTDENEGADAS